MFTKAWSAMKDAAVDNMGPRGVKSACYLNLALIANSPLQLI